MTGNERGGEGRSRADGGDREYPDPPVEVHSIAPDALSRRLRAGEPVRLLDVRDRDEVAAWRIDGLDATLSQLPFSRFLQAQVTDSVADLAEEVEGEGPITVVCGRGEASDYVAGLLAEAGIEARNLAGGMRGWAQVYEARTLRESDPTIVQYERPASGCLSYLVVHGDEAAVVDPLRAVADRYAEDAADRDADLTAAVDTHVHADHVSGVRDLLAATDATAYLPERSIDRGVTFEATGLGAGDAVPVGVVRFEATPLPGHTTDMTGFRVAGHLLSGDSVFLDSVARPDLQEAGESARDLAATLHETLTERLAALDEGTTVSPGHRGEETQPAADGTFTAPLGRIRERLSYFGMDREAFVETAVADLPPTPANVERIVALNLGRESVDEGTAGELELGPNNCAIAPTQGD
jgi:glyoxylase-like metal-dependent hydrolase (beta-lactamase superfamily II)/rhodanese-related sulfurtransferase